MPRQAKSSKEIIWDKPTGKKGERRRIVDCLVKDVRPGKLDGMYLPELSGQESVWNWRP